MKVAFSAHLATRLSQIITDFRVTYLAAIMSAQWKLSQIITGFSVTCLAAGMSDWNDSSHHHDI